MGKKCVAIKCPYLAVDGTCLLPENELEEKCPARERSGHEEGDEWMTLERLKAIGVIQ
ncbi:MAG: hypothetical protein QXY88_03405 [Candidatus Bathyarchaeia archaeon]